MSDEAGIGRKRAAQKQLSRDGNDSGDDEEEVTTPQIADAETLASRRILRVKRPGASAQDSAKTPLFAALKAATNAPRSTTASTLPTSFSGGFGATKKEGEGSEPAKPPQFSFGNFGATPSAAAKTEDEGKKSPLASEPKPSPFAFGAKATSPSDSTSTADKPKPAFSFGVAPKTDAAAAEVKKKEDSKESSSNSNGILGIKVDTPSVFGGSGAFSFKVPEGTKVPEAPKPVEIPTEDVAVSTGEEGETTEFSCSCKLFVMSNKEWKERGSGDVKLNVKEKEGAKKARLLLRDSKIKRGLLNTHIDSTFKVGKVDETYMIFTAPDDENEIKSYLLKTFTTPQQNAKEAMSTLSKAIKAHAEASMKK